MKTNSTITINPTGHKIYFSSALVRTYSLEGKYFVITLTSCGASLRISAIPFKGAFRISKYNGAFYLKSKELHLAFMNAFNQTEQKIFQLIVRPSKKSGLLFMEINKSFSGPNDSMRGLNNEDRARAMYAEMIRTDFPGRIKTASMLALEKRFQAL